MIVYGTWPRGALDSLADLEELTDAQENMAWWGLTGDALNIGSSGLGLLKALAKNAKNLAYKGKAKPGGKIYKKQMKKHAMKIKEGSNQIIGDAIGDELLGKLVDQLGNYIDKLGCALNPAYCAGDAIGELAENASQDTYDTLKQLQDLMRRIKDEMHSNCCEEADNGLTMGRRLKSCEKEVYATLGIYLGCTPS